MTDAVLKDGFGMKKPRIAVCALNPHGKEAGVEEEKKIAATESAIAAAQLRLGDPETFKSHTRAKELQTEHDRLVAQIMHDLQIDIAVDLKGYTQDARTEILEYRPSPIQVSYLGYPGTMGSRAMDYIIADKTVAPFEDAPFFSEKIVQLPDSYQVNDTHRKVSPNVPTRSAAGLPERGFVFCSFNNNWKKRKKEKKIRH